ncbi:MAG: RluA family pseudouridine synthase [Clostridiales bacterium]|jgi:23S rRNA pseudouridine1911/1915/1917 synthase|nr:RluA family pseudouridine synthase [Clostridiales bacterium]
MPDLTKRVCAEDAGKTVGHVLKYDFHISAGMLKKLKAGCLISVNGAFARTNQLLAEGDTVLAALRSVPESTESVPPDGTPISILYEDDALIALNKPAGIIVHPSTTQAKGTVANGLAEYYRAKGLAAKIHPVSRLDRETTGVILFAKDGHTKQLMASAMKRHEYEKEYIAIACGAPCPPRGAIELPIGRAPGSIMLRRVDASGKWAKTYYEVVAASGRWSLVKLFPVTGRTHQLRVHMAAMGCPLLADGLYGPGGPLPAPPPGILGAGAPCGEANTAAPCNMASPATPCDRPSLATTSGVPNPAAPCGVASPAAPPNSPARDASAGDPADGPAPSCPAMQRHALHAWRVSFAHPYSNEQITIKAPPPQDFLRAAAQLLWLLW